MTLHIFSPDAYIFLLYFGCDCYFMIALFKFLQEKNNILKTVVIQKLNKELDKRYTSERSSE